VIATAWIIAAAGVIAPAPGVIAATGVTAPTGVAVVVVTGCSAGGGGALRDADLVARLGLGVVLGQLVGVARVVGVEGGVVAVLDEVAAGAWYLRPGDPLQLVIAALDQVDRQRRVPQVVHLLLSLAQQVGAERAQGQPLGGRHRVRRRALGRD